jgi:dihydroneopterin aldolase
VSDDRIELRGMRLLCVVGVLEHEQGEAQPVEVDLDVMCDLRRPGETDHLADTVDYGLLCTQVEQASLAPAALLESLAQRIADAVLAADARIRAVTVALRKLRPPVAQHLSTSGVRITRERVDLPASP